MNAGGIQNCCGTVFSMMPDGTGYTVLHTFDTNDGGQGGPRGALLLQSGELYGMTRYGGANNVGSVFKVGTDGTGYSTLVEFDTFSEVGGLPSGSLITDGNFLYGLSTFGGVDHMGHIFRIGFDGAGFERLFDFTGQATGREPWGSLTAVDGAMYGMTWKGGQTDRGVVFRYGSSTDVESLADEDDLVRVYPNPASDVITVELDGISPKSQYSLRILNTTGHLLSQEMITDNRMTISTKAKGFASGMYLYEVTSPNGPVHREKLMLIGE